MKKAMLTFIVAFTFLVPGIMLVTPGCANMNQQKVTYNTLFSIEKSVTSAIDAYDQLVIQGKVKTNDVPKVSLAYNAFQSTMRLAISAAAGNTNAVAPPSLIVESQNLINTINTATKGHQ